MQTIRISVKGSRTLPLNDLIEYQGELKSLAKEDYERLKTSILELGFTSPFHLWLHPDGKWRVLDGHQRLRVLKNMREKERFSIPDLPIVEIDAVNNEQAKKILLALASQYGKLEGQGLYHFMADAKLSLPEVERLYRFPEIKYKQFKYEFFKELPKEGLCDEDEIPEVSQNDRYVRGDLFALGNHRLLCGDSTNIGEVDRLMNGEKADMVFTDPPYGMKLDTDYTSMDSGLRNVHKHKSVIGDDESFDFLTSYALVEGVPEQFWFGADYYCEKLPKNGSWIVWDKSCQESFDKIYGSAFELCWSKTKHKRDLARVVWKGMFGHNKKDDGDSKVHPTMKPIKLIEWFFERFKGDKVLDLFGGSGSTLIACEKTNRRCFMMEIDPHYCSVIISRWEKFTGQKAERIEASLD